jgi:hypothetical protein
MHILQNHPCMLTAYLHVRPLAPSLYASLPSLQFAVNHPGEPLSGLALIFPLLPDMLLDPLHHLSYRWRILVKRQQVLRYA